MPNQQPDNIHGRSPHNDAFNYTVLTQDLKGYCNELKLTNIVLLGHSMGGKVAMLFAVTYPEFVNKLIVSIYYYLGYCIGRKKAG